jgi:two-component system, chemotaxis family, chemotaxis protein CheY
MKSPFADSSILIIDEDWFTNNLMAAVLMEFETGQIKRAGSYEEARDIINSEDIDCIICDWLQSRRHGLDLIKYVRRSKRKDRWKVPIVLYTGYTEFDKVLEARDAGVHEIVAKPITPGAVMRKLFSAMNSERNFVRSESYSGPDRRRRNVAWKGPNRRVKGPIAA